MPTRSLTGTSRVPWAAQVAPRVGTTQFMSAAKTSTPPVATASSSVSQLPVRPTKTSSTSKRWTSSWPVSMEPTMRRPLAPAAFAASWTAGSWAAAISAAPTIGSWPLTMMLTYSASMMPRSTLIGCGVGVPQSASWASSSGICAP